jgi:hypothetical protein
MNARQHTDQPIVEYSGRMTGLCAALFAARWLGIVSASGLNNSGICAKGGGQH